MLNGRTVDTAAESYGTGTVSNGILELVDNGCPVQNLMTIGGRVIRILDNLVAPRVDNVQFIQGVAVHGTGHESHIMRVLGFHKDNSEFTHVLTTWPGRLPQSGPVASQWHGPDHDGLPFHSWPHHTYHLPKGTCSRK